MGVQYVIWIISLNYLPFFDFEFSFYCFGSVRGHDAGHDAEVDHQAERQTLEKYGLPLLRRLFLDFNLVGGQTILEWRPQISRRGQIIDARHRIDDHDVCEDYDDMIHLITPDFFFSE